MLSMYVFSNGHTVTEVVNAVSAFMATDGFSKAMSIAVMFSVIGCAIQYIKTHDLMNLLKWFSVYFCVSFLLVGVKTDLNIVDLTDKMTPHVVDNVPYGIAMPASIITSLEAGLTQGIEDVFHTPDDITYSNTGMLFGAQLFNQVNNTSVILDENTKAQFNAFIGQCVIPDILINKKYTFSAISKSDDILGFLANQNMSPLRGIYLNNQFTTCKDALPILTKAIEGNVDQQSSWLSKLLFGQKTISTNALYSKIQSIYSQMMDISENAKNILYQNTMINAIREGINTEFAKNNAGAAMVNFGYSSAMQKQLLADNTLARVATYMIPIMHTIFILLVIATFPIVAMLSLQPLYFGKSLKMYINSLIYLAMWPILFTIINFFMTTVLSHYMSAIAISQNNITLSNQNALLHEAEQFSAYCGYLIALVPVLSGFLFKGLDAVFMNAAQTMVGNMQGWSSQTAMGLADGNIQLANTSVGNHSWNNWSANKHDSNYTSFSGMHTHQLANGATVTHTPLGTDIYNTSGAISQLATSIYAGSMISAQLSKSLDHSKQVVQQESENYSHAINQSWGDMQSFSNAHGLSQSSGHNYSVSDQTSASQAVSNIMGIVHDVAQRNHMSEQEAYQHLQGFGVNANVGIGGELGFPVGKVGASINGNLGASGNYSHSNSYGTSHDEGGSINVSSNEQHQFSENYNIVKNASNTQHTDQSNSHTLSGLSQLSTDLRRSDSIASQLSSSLSDTDRYSNMLNYAQNHSETISNNFAQAFAAHIKSEYPEEAQTILSNTDNVEIASKREALAESFIKNTYMDQFKEQFNSSHSSITQQYQSERSQITNKNSQIESNFENQKDSLNESEFQSGVVGSVDGSSIKSQIASVNKNINNKVKAEKKLVEDSNKNLSEQTNKKILNAEKFTKDKRSWT